MAEDYSYLETIGRQVSDWGREAAKLGILQSETRHRKTLKVGGRHARSKREILKEKLAIEDIEMLLLPEGMERRRLNQSSWDSK